MVKAQSMLRKYKSEYPAIKKNARVLYLYTKYNIVACAWPGGRVRARANVCCIQVLYTRYPIHYRFVCKIPLLARALGLIKAARPSARATIGYLVYNLSLRASKISCIQACVATNQSYLF